MAYRPIICVLAAVAILAITLSAVLLFQDGVESAGLEAEPEPLQQQAVAAPGMPQQVEPIDPRIQRKAPAGALNPASQNRFGEAVQPARRVPLDNLVPATVVAKSADKTWSFPGAEKICRRLHQKDTTPDEDITTLQELVKIFRGLNNGAGPEGGFNAEIVQALRGQNPKGVVLLSGDNLTYDPEGQLLDRWGTPYFFHPLSDSVLEIRSAGPDLLMWSKDDVQPTTRGLDASGPNNLGPQSIGLNFPATP